MLVVTALGGNALLRRGEPMTPDNQRASVRLAARALARLAPGHQLVISLGKGPQPGLLALQAAAYARVETHPPDVLGALTEAMSGYMLQQELADLLADERPCATVATMVEVDPADPAFCNPDRFVGPLYLREEAERLAADRGWVFRPDVDKWRRVVASPEPSCIIELRPIKWLIERNTIVIAAGGGGIPVMFHDGAARRLTAAECLIDSDLAAGRLARELAADVFVLLTDVDAVYVDWGRTTARAVRRASPEGIAALPLEPCSMGAKVKAACRFAADTGRPAVIGALSDLERLIAGEAGTTVTISAKGVTCATGAFAGAGGS